jgi:hypothetical protein
MTTPESEILKRLDNISERLDGMDNRLAVIDVNWGRTLRTWVRLERQGQERERGLDQLKKNSTPHSWSWTLPGTR